MQISPSRIEFKGLNPLYKFLSKIGTEQLLSADNPQFCGVNYDFDNQHLPIISLSSGIFLNGKGKRKPNNPCQVYLETEIHFQYPVLLNRLPFVEILDTYKLKINDSLSSKEVQVFDAQTRDLEMSLEMFRGLVNSDNFDGVSLFATTVLYNENEGFKEKGEFQKIIKQHQASINEILNTVSGYRVFKPWSLPKVQINLSKQKPTRRWLIPQYLFNGII